MQKAIDDADFGVYDMEIMNALYGRQKDCIVLPHRKYALLTGEFRRKTHRQYMGDDTWNAKAAFDEAKIIHFSDHPLPKPWDAKWEEVKDFKPECEESGDCQARDIWLTLYTDYWKRAHVGSDFLFEVVANIYIGYLLGRIWRITSCVLGSKQKLDKSISQVFFNTKCAELINSSFNQLRPALYL